MTFVGKIHVFSRWFFPSAGWLLEHQLRFKEEHGTRLSGPSARIPTVFPLFDKKFYLFILAQGHFGRDGNGTLGEKNNRSNKPQKTNF